MATQFTQWLPPDARSGVAERRVRKTFQDLLDIVIVLLLVEAVLADESSATFSQRPARVFLDVFISDCLVYFLDTVNESEVGESCMAAIECEELALAADMSIFSSLAQKSRTHI